MLSKNDRKKLTTFQITKNENQKKKNKTQKNTEKMYNKP